MTLRLPKIFFTADHHFGHEAIIRHCHRPFSTVEEMNEGLIERWNAMVDKHDWVYHLGDFFLHMNQQEALAIRKRLNGNIFLILGNHDDVAKSIPQAFSWTKERYRLNLKQPAKLNIVLDHYSGRVWSGSHKGTIQLYGHSHGNLMEDPMLLQFDVGVDCWEFYPVSLDQVLEKIQKKKDAIASLAPWPCIHGHQHASCEEAWKCMMNSEPDLTHGY